MPSRRQTSKVPRHTSFHERSLGRARMKKQQLLMQQKEAGPHHINHMWASLDAVTYPRYSDGAAVPVTVPNSKHGTAMVERTQLLVTKALDTPHRLYNHCAHYYFNGVCDLGAECHFIHLVFVKSVHGRNKDATASTHRRDSSSEDDLHFLPVGSTKESTAPPRSPPGALPPLPGFNPDRTVETSLATEGCSAPASRRFWFRDPYTATRITVMVQSAAAAL